MELAIHIAILLGNYFTTCKSRYKPLKLLFKTIHICYLNYRTSCHRKKSIENEFNVNYFPVSAGDRLFIDNKSIYIKVLYFFMVVDILLFEGELFYLIG